MSSNNTTTTLITTNASNNNLNRTYNALFEAEIWTSISLSTLSFIALVAFLIVYTIAHIKSRDHAKENKKTAFKKMCKNEYLVLSYCISLIITHFITISQKAIQFLFTNAIVNPISHNYVCLTIAILKHHFWLLSLVHCSAISFKLYFKLTKNMNNEILERNDWLKAIVKTLSLITLLASLISVCAIILHFTIPTETVYELRINDYNSLANYCFLRQPIFLAVFFALPILIILIFNLTIFILLFVKTKATIDQSENEEKNNLFLKLAVLMGLSWFVYVISVCLVEAMSDTIFIQIVNLIASVQTNLHGFLIVLVLFSNATYEKLFKKKKSTKKNNNNHHEQQLQMQQQLQQNQTTGKMHNFQRRLTVL